MSFYTYIVMEKYWSCFKISFHDSKKANGKEEKGCRIGKQGFEAAVLPGGVHFRCQALQRSNSWDLSELKNGQTADRTLPAKGGISWRGL